MVMMGEVSSGQEPWTTGRPSVAEELGVGGDSFGGSVAAAGAAVARSWPGRGPGGDGLGMPPGPVAVLTVCWGELTGSGPVGTDGAFGDAEGLGDLADSPFGIRWSLLRHRPEPKASASQQRASSERCTDAAWEHGHCSALAASAFQRQRPDSASNHRNAGTGHRHHPSPRMIAMLHRHRSRRGIEGGPRARVRDDRVCDPASSITQRRRGHCTLRHGAWT